MSLIVVVFCILFCWGTEWASAKESPRQNVSAHNLDDNWNATCADRLNLKAKQFPSAANKEETLTVAGRFLQIQAGAFGAVDVTAWDSPSYSIKLCARVASASQNLSTQLLNETELRAEQTTVSITTPAAAGDHIVVTALMVKAPRDAILSLQAKSGRVSLNGFFGEAKVQTTNGEISVKQSSGSLDLESVNGGITIWDCAGDVHAITRNGGITLVLANRWSGNGLRVHTENGGLTVALAKDLSSGLEIVGPVHLSLTCVGNACENARRLLQDGHRVIHLGSNTTQIHAEVVNSAVTILNRH